LDQIILDRTLQNTGINIGGKDRREKRKDIKTHTLILSIRDELGKDVLVSDAEESSCVILHDGFKLCFFRDFCLQHLDVLFRV
jgi:hypothetical protein